MRHIPALISALTLLLAASCSRAGIDRERFTTTLCTPRDATGFEILADADTAAMLFITRSPWQGAGGHSTEYLLTADAPRRIVAMSSSHIAMLDAIGAADAIVGVSGKRFVGTPSLAARLDSIVDVGYEGNVDYEALVAARPDLVMLYGVNGASSMEPKLDELGIPYVYIGDYMEQTPLGKAEWMRFLGYLTGHQAAADSVYARIAARYDSLKALADSVDARPAVMLNAPMGDTWYMASPDSYMALLITDAGGSYLYDGPSDGRASVPVDFESAYSMAARADCWLNAGNVATAAALESLYPKLAGLRAVKGRCVYNNVARLTAGGGNDFWESGSVNPDIVLADIISILHPGLLPDHRLHYFIRLK